MEVKTSHFISRHLTKPWEFSWHRGQRQLWYYDFDRDDFRVGSSKTLFTLDEPLSSEAEELFNKVLETPLSRYLAKRAINQSTAISRRELRALKLALFLQVERTIISRDGATAETRSQFLLTRTEEWFDGLVAAADQDNEFVNVPLRKERLFFPDTGVIVLPIDGARPALALPIHPACLVVVVPRGHAAQVQKLRAMGEDNLTALSSGLDPCRRIVIPGSLRGHTDISGLREAIHEARALGKALLKTSFDRNQASFGNPMPGWPPATPSSR